MTKTNNANRNQANKEKTMTNATRQALTVQDSFRLAEGDLFEYQGEDAILLFFYISIIWIDAQGVERINNNFSEFGYNARPDAEAFVSRIRKLGSVNLTKWDLVNPGPTLEDRLGPYGIEWELEQADRRA